MDEPIPISSSDSDIDYEYGSIEVEDDAFSTNVRARGYGEHSGDVFFPQTATSRMRRPLNHGHTLHTEYPRNPFSDAGFQSSTFQRQFPSAEHQNYSMKHLESPAFPFQPSLHSKKHKETPAFPFPPSFHAKPNNFRDSEHMRQFNGSGNSYPFTGPSSSLNGENHEKPYPSGRYGTGNSYPFTGPSTFDKDFMHAKPYPSGRYGSSVDPIDPFKNGDEKLGGTDERSVFQEVIQGLNQPKQEAELPDGLLSVPLLRHQKIALAWMRQKEARPFCVGGILADDQGLGKTISTIVLIQMDRYSEKKSKSEDHKNNRTLALTSDDDDDKGIVCLDDVKPAKDLNAVKFISNGNHTTLNLDDDDDDDQKGVVNLVEVKPEKDFNFFKFISKGSSSQQSSSKQRPAAGTLVVCPATVLRQWARELQDKVTEEAKLKVLIYHGSNRTKDPSELASYDVVLTTYALVANEVPKQPLVDEDDNGENREKNAENSLGAKRKKNQSRFPKKGKKSKKGLDSCFFVSEGGTLAKVRWLRVVLDEAQTIKNHRTQAARACCGLRAKKRWCLSGTPMQNTIDELFSYFRFLKYDPYSSYVAFRDGIKAPIAKNGNSGYKKLQVVLRTVMLRRTKGTIIDGKPILSLPPKHINMIPLDLTSEERYFYTNLEHDSRVQFKAYDDAGTVNQNYANILLLLLRLRQACDHPYLCEAASDFVKRIDSIKTLKQLPKDTVISLNNRLQGSVICRSCEDTPEEAIVTICGHIFCVQCILDHLSSDDNTCPATNCKEKLSTKVIFSKATFRCFISNGSDSENSSSQSDCNQCGEKSLSVTSSEYTSSKIKRALDILQSLGKPSVQCIDLDGPADDDDAPKSDALVCVRTEIIDHGMMTEARQKAIVFSQWTRMLDLMEASLIRYGINYRRLDGSMNLAARDDAVREFNTDPEVDVMLMSLKAGNLGLNMVAACHVILLDLWWNPTTEDQAIDRAHRIGQTRAVTVSRLTVKDSVEDRILALQEKKRKMVASAFGEENTGGSARLSVQDLRFLFMGA